MQRIAVVLATICIFAVSGDHNCTKSGGCGGPSTCGPLEIPVQGKPQRDTFCRPLFTPVWELHKLRRCVCKRRYLRNSWGECIPRKKCIPCKFRWQRDYRTCAPGCPATCNKPFGTSCNKPCTAGCDCPPGWVVHPKLPKMCIKANKCLPKCPENSSFQSCVSNCRPKCGESRPNRCDFQCDKGACICKKGYVELQRGGEKSCILEAKCAWYTRTKPLFKPNITLNTGKGRRVPVTTNITRVMVGRPGSTALLVPSGHVSTSSAAELGGSTVSMGRGGTHLPTTAGTAGSVVLPDTEATSSPVATVHRPTPLRAISGGTVSSTISGHAGLVGMQPSGGTEATLSPSTVISSGGGAGGESSHQPTAQLNRNVGVGVTVPAGTRSSLPSGPPTADNTTSPAARPLFLPAGNDRFGIVTHAASALNTGLYSGGRAGRYMMVPTPLVAAGYRGGSFRLNPFQMPSFGSFGYSGPGFERYPRAAQFLAPAGYAVTRFGFDPWASPSLIGPPQYGAAFGFYPWGLSLPSRIIGNRWTGFGISPWGSPLQAIPGHDRAHLGFHPWNTFSRSAAAYGIAGFPFGRNSIYAPRVIGFPRANVGM